MQGAAPAPVGPVVHLLVNDVTERGLRGAGGSSATGASASHLQTGTIMRNLWTRSCDAQYLTDYQRDLVVVVRCAIPVHHTMVV